MSFNLFTEPFRMACMTASSEMLDGKEGFKIPACRPFQLWFITTLNPTGELPFFITSPQLMNDLLYPRVDKVSFLTLSFPPVPLSLATGSSILLDPLGNLTVTCNDDNNWVTPLGFTEFSGDGNVELGWELCRTAKFLGLQDFVVERKCSTSLSATCTQAALVEGVGKHGCLHTPRLC